VAQKTFATNDVLTAADCNELGKSPQSNDVATGQTTSSTSYAALATAGPSRTMTLNNGTVCLIIVSAYMSTAVAGDEAYMSFAVSGATTQASSDANAAHHRSASGNARTTVTRVTVFTATATGSHTFTSQYKYVNNGGGADAYFQDRRLIVLPKF
jgi:hypothetical protein